MPSSTLFSTIDMYSPRLFADQLYEPINDTPSEVPAVMLLGPDGEYTPFKPQGHIENTPGSVGQVSTCLWALKLLMDKQRLLGGETQHTHAYLDDFLRTDLPVKGANLFPAHAAVERAIALSALANMYTDPQQPYDWRYHAADVATSIRALPQF